MTNAKGLEGLPRRERTRNARETRNIELPETEEKIERAGT